MLILGRNCLIEGKQKLQRNTFSLCIFLFEKELALEKRPALPGGQNETRGQDLYAAQQSWDPWDPLLAPLVILGGKQKRVPRIAALLQASDPVQDGHTSHNVS